MSRKAPNLMPKGAVKPPPPPAPPRKGTKAGGKNVWVVYKVVNGCTFMAGVFDTKALADEACRPFEYIVCSVKLNSIWKPLLNAGWTAKEVNDMIAREKAIKQSNR